MNAIVINDKNIVVNQFCLTQVEITSHKFLELSASNADVVLIDSSLKTSLLKKLISKSKDLELQHIIAIKNDNFLSNYCLLAMGFSDFVLNSSPEYERLSFQEFYR